MTTEAFKKGNKKLTKVRRTFNKELMLYFEVDMEQNDIKTFAKMLSITGNVERFYACVVVSDKDAPRTHVAYEKNGNPIVDMEVISTGILPTDLLQILL